MMHDPHDTRVESSIPLSLLERVDQVGDRFEDAWAAGARPTIEAFLAESPEPERALLLRELLGLELYFRRRAGETPNPAEYLSRFPGHAAVIHQVFADTPAGAARPDKSEVASRATPPDAEPPSDAGSGVTPQQASASEAATAAGDWPVVPGYEILGVLGKGGMGVVYRARHQGLERVVALKMIRAGTQAVPEELARFRTEAALQARLHHPNIVQIFEVGEVAGGPYFALECVDGSSLDKRIAGQPQQARAAAQLVETLARAVQHAHAKGLVHRDLKPSNILLTADGTPKVGDFGLAKRLEGDAGQTQSGAVVGTPNYMAPEQAWGRRKAIGPATDVYALGAILYELLTGRPPFLGATPVDTVMQVRHQEPVPPRRWLAPVPRDLETICLKCLQKEPAQRYGSAAALAEDLKRFLHGEPIQARPSPVWEKALKWARRKPAAAALIGVSGLALLALFGVILGFTLQLQAALHATQEQRERAEERQRAAEANERKAEAVRAFLEHDLLRQADPAEQADAVRQAGSGFETTENPTIKELLDRAAAELTPEKIEAKFPKQPEVQASILRTVGDTYRGIGAYDKAVQFLVRASDTYRQLFAAAHPDTLASMDDLALAYYVRGNTAEAITLFEQVRDIKAQSRGTDHPDTLTTRNHLALAYLAAGRTTEAIDLLEEVGDTRRKLLRADHPNTLSTLNNLALAYLAAGRTTDAIGLLEHVLDANLQQLGAHHPDTLKTMDNLGSAYVRAGRVLEAIALWERVRDARMSKLGADHPATLVALSRLASAYRAAGRIIEAVALYERVRDAWVSKCGMNHPATRATLNNLALAYLTVGRTPEAIAIYERVRDANRRELGANHPDTLTTLDNLAGAYQAAERMTEAIALWERVRDARMSKLGRDHPDTLTTLNNLAMAYHWTGKTPEAVALLERVRDARMSKLGVDHPDTLNTLNNLGLTYLAAGRTTGAIALLERVRDARTSKLGVDHPDTLNTLDYLARAYQVAGRITEAIALLERVRDAQMNQLGANNSRTVATLNNLALAYRVAGRTPEAIALFEQVRDTNMQERGADHPTTLITLNNLALAYEDAGEMARAIALFEKVHDALVQKVSADHPTTLTTLNNLAAAYLAAEKPERALTLFQKAATSVEKQKFAHPYTGLIISGLCECHERLKQYEPAEAWGRKWVAVAKERLGPQSAAYAGALTTLGRNLLLQQQYAEAEQTLRDNLALRTRLAPEAWTTFNTKSLLGEALSRQQKYAEAEPLLKDGYQGLRAREKTIAPVAKVCLTGALDRLVQLYDAWGKPEQAEHWRREGAPQPAPKLFPK